VSAAALVPKRELDEAGVNLL